MWYAPSMDFDALVETARMGMNKTGEFALHQAVLSIPTWYFVAQGEGDEVEPLIGVVEGVPHILAFTEEFRAAGYADILGRQRGGAAPGVLSMDVPDALDYFKVLAQHKVEGVAFNSGDYAFAITFTALNQAAKSR